MEISVIIPSYRPGDYIYKCIESLSSQYIDKSVFEVIIVLNGCNEPFYTKIVDYIKHCDINIRIIQTEVAGVSNARNIALDIVTGKYVAFIDDDDYVSPSYLSELYDIAEAGYVPLSNIVAFDDATNEHVPNYISDVFTNKSDNKVCYRVFQIRSYLSVPVCKLIRKDMVNSIRFDERLKNGEDSLFMFSISNKMKYFKFTTSNATYYRRVRKGSATTIKRTKIERMKNAYYLINQYTKVYLSNVKEYVLSFYISRIVAALINM